MTNPRADKGQRHEVRQDERLPLVTDAEKRCPDSIRFVLMAARKTFNAGRPVNHTVFREAMNASWPRGRLGREDFTHTVFESTEQGVAPFYYGYIEGYARALGVPSSLILLISRSISDREDRGSLASLEMLRRFEAALSQIRVEIDAGRIKTDRAVRRILDSYLKDSEELNPTTTE